MISAAVQILKMESLMSLARELTFEEGKTLGEQLGVKPETIKQIKDGAEKDPVGANFQILCTWRGRWVLSSYCISVSLYVVTNVITELFLTSVYKIYNSGISNVKDDVSMKDLLRLNLHSTLRTIFLSLILRLKHI